MSNRLTLPTQRRERIRQILLDQKYASVRELADRIEVSDMTIRRDLELLAIRGVIRRVFGGARIDGDAVESVYADRLQQNRQAKERIARRAVGFVRQGDTIALDGSTTSVYLARELRRYDVTVLTNSLLIAQELADGDLEVVLPGGTLRERTRSLVGPLTERTLNELHVDTTFFSTGGIHAEYGLTDTHELEASAKRVLLSISERCIALIDASKFGQKALHYLASFDRLDSLVTDASLPRELGDALERNGVEVASADG